MHGRRAIWGPERENASAIETAELALQMDPNDPPHIARSAARYGLRTRTTAPLPSSINPFA
jgi:hypothetical protein